MQQIQLTENIYYVGVNDRHTDMFENHMELPNGVSYNSYLIVDEKVALIDPVEANFLEEYLFKVKSVLQGRKVDYLIINHDEPDHSSTVAAVLREYPEVHVVGNAKTFGPLEAFYGPIENKVIVAEGETLTIGFRFALARVDADLRAEQQNCFQQRCLWRLRSPQWWHL